MILANVVFIFPFTFIIWILSLCNGNYKIIYATLHGLNAIGAALVSPMAVNIIADITSPDFRAGALSVFLVISQFALFAGPRFADYMAANYKNFLYIPCKLLLLFYS